MSYKIVEKHYVIGHKIIRNLVNIGKDWAALSIHLNVPYNPAYQWVKSGDEAPLMREKQKMIKEKKTDEVIG